MKKSESKRYVRKDIKTDNNRGLKIIIRYLVLLMFMFSLPWIYQIFTPLTTYPVLGLLKIMFNDVILKGTTIILNFKTVIELVPACIAGSAYLLLLVLNLSTNITLKKRLYSLVFTFALFLLLNILRIFTLIILYENSFQFFDLTHKIFWYLLSTVFVLAIWFVNVKVFKIEKIPIYDDIKTLLEDIK